MFGNLTPPFTPPAITDPLATANASQGYAEFNALKNYLVSWISVQFDPTTGLFLSTVRAPLTFLPQFSGDVTNTPGAAGGTITVKGLNGSALSGMTSGLLAVTNGSGAVAGVTALPNGFTATTQAQNDNSTKVATTAYVNVLIEKGQILGSSTNDSANAGNIGEVFNPLLASASAVSITTATPTNVLSQSLTAGDWDVGGNLNFKLTGTTETGLVAGIGVTSATLPSDGSECYSGYPTTALTANATISVPKRRISLAATTTVYLIGQATFSAGTVGGFGGLWCRRVR